MSQKPFLGTTPADLTPDNSLSSSETAERSQDTVERRHEVRRPARPSTRGLCHSPLADGKDNLCLGIVDLVSAGACLLLSRQLDVGSEVEITLVSPSAFRYERRKARVVWASPNFSTPPQFMTGMEFDRPLNDCDLSEFVVIL